MTRSECEKYVRFHKYNIEWNRMNAVNTVHSTHSNICIWCLRHIWHIYDTCIKSPFASLKLLKKVPNLQHNQHFYLDILVSIRDLHQKKFVQFLFRFLAQ